MKTLKARLFLSLSSVWTLQLQHLVIEVGACDAKLGTEVQKCILFLLYFSLKYFCPFSCKQTNRALNVSRRDCLNLCTTIRFPTFNNILPRLHDDSWLLALSSSGCSDEAYILLPLYLYHFLCFPSQDAAAFWTALFFTLGVNSLSLSCSSMTASPCTKTAWPPCRNKGQNRVTLILRQKMSYVGGLEQQDVWHDTIQRQLLYHPNKDLVIPAKQLFKLKHFSYHGGIRSKKYIS